MGKDTELTRTNVRSPYVQINVSEYGTVTAHLTAYRVKPRGGTEEITFAFSDLDANHLACIAHSAVSAMRSLRRVQEERIVKNIEYATGWAEGEGPRE